MGIDLYDRGSDRPSYKPGFGCCQAFPTIKSANPGLSATVFGPGWTWDNTNTLNGDKGYTWDQWFDYDKMLWVGPSKSDMLPADATLPICRFFPKIPPPNPMRLAFYTAFCPGVGLDWFVSGVQVLESNDGWTDIQKQTSLGDMLWPTPMLQWDSSTHDSDPVASLKLRMDNAWNGGSCVELSFVAQAEQGTGCFPIQSFALTPGQEYEATLIYHDDNTDLTLSLALVVDRLSPSITQVSLADTKVDTLPLNWYKLFTRFSVAADHPNDVLTSIGLHVDYSTTLQVGNFSFLLGQMNVVPVLPPPMDGSTIECSVLWADFEITTAGSTATLPSGILIWDVTTFFDQPQGANNNTGPPWTLQSPELWLPKFIYFNIYAQAEASDGTKGEVTFIGTTGLDGHANRFFVDPNVWPDGFLAASNAYLYMQGVTDYRDVLLWDHCASTVKITLR